MSITATVARNELERRAANRKMGKKGQKFSKIVAVSPEAMRMTKVELRLIAGAAAKVAAKVPAEVAPKGRVAAPGVENRKLAKQVARAWYQAHGKGMSYRESCILAGTLPAGEITGGELTAKGIAMTVAEELPGLLVKFPGVMDLDV